MLATDKIRHRGGGGGGGTNAGEGGVTIPQGNHELSKQDPPTHHQHHRIIRTSNTRMKRRKRGSSSSSGGRFATIRLFTSRVNRWLRRGRINPQQFFAYAVGAFFILFFILICSTFIIYHRITNRSTDHPQVVGVLGPEMIASGGGGGLKKLQQHYQGNNNVNNLLSNLVNINKPVSIMISAFTYPHLSKSTIQQLFYMPDKENWGHAIKDEETPDYGGLEIKFFADSNAIRNIYDGDYQRNGPPKNSIDDEADEEQDGYYAFDDDELRGGVVVAYDANNNKDYDSNLCRRISDHRLNFPTCNRVHENGLIESGVTFIGEGAYRQVFVIDHDMGGKYERIVMKDLQAEEAMTYDNYEFIRMDAIVAERLTSSPRIFNIYGYCGLSIVSQFFHHGDVEGLILAGDGGYNKVLTRDDPKKIHPTNKLTPIQKLVMALEMALGLADLHGYEGGVIIHDDIQNSQFLFNSDKSMVVLNDFNRAEFPLWDAVNEEYCRYQNGRGHGNWRAPEEYKDLPLTEKIDVWSLGCNMLTILTGLNPHYTVHDYDKYRKTLLEGKIPEIDPRYKTRSKEEGILFGLIEKCFQWSPEDRPSVFEIVDILQKAVNKSLEPGQTTAKVLKSIDSSEWDWMNDAEYQEQE